jgi:hypothetical protein
MKILSVLTFAGLLLYCSCSTNKANECNGVNGTLKITNNADFKYDIYINDVKKGTLAAGGNSTWPLTEDYYAIKAIQAEGVNGTPLQYTWNPLVTACGSTGVSIP